MAMKATRVESKAALNQSRRQIKIKGGVKGSGKRRH
jgi:hypothetical protein